MKTILKEIDLRAHAGWHERKDRRLDRASVHSRVEDDEEMVAVTGCGRDRSRALRETARPRERERAEERETVRAEVTELDMQVSICAPETTQTQDWLRRGGDRRGNGHLNHSWITRVTKVTWITVKGVL